MRSRLIEKLEPARLRLYAPAVFCAVFMALSLGTNPSKPSALFQAVMNQSADDEVLRRFRELLRTGDLDPVVLTVTVGGGMPGEKGGGWELSVSGRKEARAKLVSSRGRLQLATAELTAAKVKGIFDLIAKGVASLTPRSRTRFVPDSLIGSLTIEVEGNRATLFYLADQAQRKAQGQVISLEMIQALDEMNRLARSLVAAGTGHQGR